MWFLKSLKDEETVHYLLVDEEYTVGRKETSIIIADDPSISRRHAVVMLSHTEANLNNAEKLPILTIKDSGSKYGTYLNKVKRIDSQGTILKVGDVVTFGQCESSYEACYQPLVISTSCIESQEKKKLKESIRKLGGHSVSEWQKNCTHLVMKEIKVTIKAVCAMVTLKPLVTPEYFTDLVEAIREPKNHPDPRRYIPKSGEPLLSKENVTFNPKLERQTLFKNKTFICTSQKQYKKLHLGITLASGKVILLEEDGEIKASTLLHPDTIVMKYQSDSAVVPSPRLPLHIETVERELKRNNMRVIPESDIGLAVVYCSTEQYCNPSYNLASNLFTTSNLHSQTLSQGDIYVEETQTSTSTSTQSSNRNAARNGSCIEDSLERNQPSVGEGSGKNSSSKKRIREEEVKVESSPKHAKLPNGILSDATQTLFVPSLLSESEYPREIKTDMSPVHSPVNPAPQISDIDHGEIESIEDAQTQRWEDFCEPEVPDGFITKPKKSSLMEIKTEISSVDQELPSKLINVEYAALCPPRSIHLIRASSTGSVRNFKKFRKVFSTTRLPRIIGGRDLMAYDRNSSRALEEWLSQNPGTEPEREEEGLFDWDPRPRSRRR